MKLPKFMLRGFSRPSELVFDSLGKLEREVMETVWQNREASVRQIFLDLNERIAYTTVMTTLDRLYKKRLLDRRKEGRAFIYFPRFSSEELEHGIAEDVIDCLIGSRTRRIEPVLACIVEAVSERDYDLLDELERLVQEKKQQLLGEE